MFCNAQLRYLFEQKPGVAVCLSKQTLAMDNPGWHFHNSYLSLPGELFSRLSPAKVPAPRMVVFNDQLAKALDLPPGASDPKQGADIWSGNVLPPGTDPIAQAYSGHQFGYPVVLGDGRAILLGEHLDSQGVRRDIQLKGSGQTPYSRRGDGKATLASMLREYLISEAVHALGIPGSRSLAVVETGEQVIREKTHQGAVLTRVSSSHLRVGSFEYARQVLAASDFGRFTDYVIWRHAPEAKEAPNPALALLNTVMERQAFLVAEWMRVGFIHGVMNTDNTGIAGETFDYGPCAFLNTYDPHTVFSSIDQQGRYAFGNQPHVIHWNLGVLAGALLPLVHADEKKAVGLVKEQLDAFPQRFEDVWLQMMRGKLGLKQSDPGDKRLIEQLLEWMQQHRADYTNTFRSLRHDLLNNSYTTSEDPSLRQWQEQWLARIHKENSRPEQKTSDESTAGQPQSTNERVQAANRMQAANPAVIPRNHLVEQALEAAAFHMEMKPFHELLEALSQPYQERAGLAPFQQAPPDGDAGYQTFCGT